MSEKQVQPEGSANDQPLLQEKVARRIILRPLERVTPTDVPNGGFGANYPPGPGA